MSKESEAKNTQSNLPDLTTVTKEDMPKLLDLTNAKIKAIKGGNPEESRITANLDGFGTIQNITEVETLLKAYSMVAKKMEAYEVAASVNSVSIEKYPFKQNGVKGKSWLSAISSRIQEVTNKSQLDRLEKVKSLLERNLSEEERFRRDLSSVWEELQG